MNPLEIKSLAQAAADDVQKAIEGWLKGVPKHELALLNRMTERLSRRRRGCRVGYRRFRVIPSCFVLHGSGDNNTDKYGSDLAVTLEVPSDRYLKTALFQIKRFGGPSVVLERAQLEAAVQLNSTQSRAFVLVVNHDSGKASIAAVTDLLSVAPPGVQSPSIKMTEQAWFPLEVWLYAWIECTVGASSDPQNPDVEYVLERFFGLAPQEPESQFEAVRDIFNEARADWHLVRSWLRFRLVVDE